MLFREGLLGRGFCNIYFQGQVFRLLFLETAVIFIFRSFKPSAETPVTFLSKNPLAPRDMMAAPGFITPRALAPYFINDLSDL